METRWIHKDVHNTKQFESLGLSKDFLNIMVNRGIDTHEKIEKFIHPKIENIVSPFEFSDVKKSVDKIIEMGKADKTIFIYGDYDVDGITSTSLCYLALKELGYKVDYYIPLRDEGYGLNNVSLSHIKEQGGDLVITVDCGVSSVEEVEYANSIGLEVIITDHHDINNILPPAYAVVNPKREDNSYKFEYLAGVGTAFMLMMGLYETLGRKEEIYQYLDIVAIGTIADIVPLKAENRIFTKLGLEQLKRTNHSGLQILLQTIFDDLEEKKFNTYDVGFIIAPIFNAAGRLEDAKMAVKLLISDSMVEAREISKKLIGQNSERKEVQADILEKVEAEIEKNRYYEDNVIVVSGVGFHHGVVGIVASKIVDKYYKPTIIMEEKDGISKASCRSIEGYSIIEGLNSMREIFIKYGGHAGAAGFSIDADKVNEFRNKINKEAGSKLSNEDYKKPVKIDKEISFTKLTYDFNNELEKAEPYGFGNATPLFEVKNVILDRVRLIGKDKTHIMFDAVSANGTALKNCVWFGSSHHFERLMEMKSVDVAFKLKVDTYMDRFNVKMFVEDIREGNSEKNLLKESIDLYDMIFPMKEVIYTKRDIDINSSTYLEYSNGITVNSGRSIVGYLPQQTESILKSLTYDYDLKFNVKITEIIKKDENYNIHITIDYDHNFKTNHFKPGGILKDIKTFILGDLDYNTLQKEVLSTVFRKKENPTIIYSGNRGMKTIIYTMGLWNKLHNKKTLVITKDILPHYFSEFLNISDRYSDGYDYYIFYNELPVTQVQGDFMVITKEDVHVDGTLKIVDNLTLPTNISILEEFEIVKDYDKTKTYFTKKLPTKKKSHIIDNLDKFEMIYSTDDILRVL
ncbi:single-stranded-DNA-specific exonuclease RecJ [Psychrilyobacter atlanticus]|uniref:single-stranded-DNA-specific exonuclease RecJ n=1 Tax=Psychrilyobacter atlanticus TaxID=271091 RepID=UPI00041BE864|nr:single-stranded-DNA-specific exonuclease RecJ [Psychrilyobacter atlanticus]